ncbi:hypothetical protein Barb7_03271 [Bacteroidales bacterium Barb7]|nr:hypothetical protein Barb7_03271 [Bacteroidales bacterium Barb7]
MAMSQKPLLVIIILMSLSWKPSSVSAVAGRSMEASSFLSIT